MKKITLLITFCFIAVALLAQNPKKGFKKLKKRDFEKAEEIFAEMLTVDSSNAIVAYGMALVYDDRSYSKFDLFKAFGYAQIASVNWENLSEDDIEDIAEYASYEQVMKDLGDIDDKLYRFVKVKKKAQLIDKFIALCGSSRHMRSVVRLKCGILYKSAKKKNTVSAFNNFIEEYPASPETKEAVLKRDGLELKKAFGSKTISAYETFIKKYPESQLADSARALRDGIAFRQAKNTNSIASYDGFLKKYPKSRFAAQAATKKEEMAYAEAVSTKKLGSFNLFLSQYHGSEKYKEVFQLKAKKLAATYAAADKHKALKNDWLTVFDYNGKRSKARGMAVGNDGNIVLTGYTKNIGNWTNDVWVTLLDANGNLLWDNNYGTPYDDQSESVAVTAENEIVLVGYCNSKKGMPKGSVWVVKLGQDGKKIWEHKFKGTRAIDVTVKNSGEIVVAGYDARHNGARDFWVAKLSPDGKKVWKKTFEGKGIASSVVANTAGEIVAVSDTWAVALDNSGNLLWETTLEESVKAYAATMDSGGSIYIVGRFYNFRTTQRSDFWVAKYSAAGKMTWKKTFDRKGMFDKAYSIDVDAGNNLIVSGISGTMKDDDLWLLKINSNGAKVSEKVFGSPQNEKHPSVAVAPDGKICVFASFGLEADCVVFKTTP